MKTSPPEACGVATPLILSCSPRQGGNCDAAAEIFARAVSEASGLTEAAPVEHLRRFRVDPCIACYRCADQSREVLYGQALRGTRPFWQCPLSLRDDSDHLLRRLALAPVLCLVAPIFFYHLPAQLKGLLDRLQPTWLASSKAGGLETDPFAPRVCHLILIAGRPKGEQLFAGSLLTLKHALKGLSISLAEPLLLRGIDAPGSLTADSQAVRAVEEYAAKACREQ